MSEKAPQPISLPPKTPEREAEIRERAATASWTIRSSTSSASSFSST